MLPRMDGELTGGETELPGTGANERGKFPGKASGSWWWEAAWGRVAVVSVTTHGPPAPATSYASTHSMCWYLFSPLEDLMISPLFSESPHFRKMCAQLGVAYSNISLCLFSKIQSPSLAGSECIPLLLGISFIPLAFSSDTSVRQTLVDFLGYIFSDTYRFFPQKIVFLFSMTPFLLASQSKLLGFMGSFCFL